MTRPSAPAPGDAAGATVVALSRVARALHGQLGEQVDDSATYFLLHQIEALGPVRLTELAARVGLDHSTVSRHVGRLLEQGTVSRRPDPDDRRAGRLELTASGRGVLEQALLRRAGLVAEATAAWPAADRAELLRLLGALAASLAAAPAGSRNPTVDADPIDADPVDADPVDADPVDVPLSPPRSSRPAPTSDQRASA